MIRTSLRTSIPLSVEGILPLEIVLFSLCRGTNRLFLFINQPSTDRRLRHNHNTTHRRHFFHLKYCCFRSFKHVFQAFWDVSLEISYSSLLHHQHDPIHQRCHFYLEYRCFPSVELVCQAFWDIFIWISCPPASFFAFGTKSHLFFLLGLLSINRHITGQYVVAITQVFVCARQLREERDNI